MKRFDDEISRIKREIGKMNGADLITDQIIAEWLMDDKADQTIKADAGKLRLTLVPRQIIWDVARIREYGTSKYGSAEAWEKVDVVRYRDAAFRHFLAYLDDPAGVDDESGLPHLWHLACNIAFLCELEDNNDDRGT